MQKIDKEWKKVQVKATTEAILHSLKWFTLKVDKPTNTGWL